ncbi:RcnB family protein [Acetobacter aceti]|nr:RcnB family protein [Acetobacter aceti]
MRIKPIAFIMASVLSIAPVCAMAQPMPGRGHQGGEFRGDGRGDRYHGGPGARDSRGGDGRYGRRGAPPPMNNWRPGARYWGGDPWIDNWRSYRGLYAPPYGYRWIQSGNQFLLTAIATGIISAVVVNGVVSGMGPGGMAPGGMAPGGMMGGPGY